MNVDEYQSQKRQHIFQAKMLVAVMGILHQVLPKITIGRRVGFVVGGQSFITSPARY